MSKLIIPIRRTTVKTKEEIVEELKKYKKVLSGEVYSYLTNLINLNNSALEEKFSNEEIALIRNMPMFDDITLYNLYYLTKEYSINHPEINLDKQINNIKLYNSEANTQNVLFDLYFNQTHDTKNKEINFYNQINDQKYYKLLDKQINEELKYEYNQENPYEIVLGRNPYEIVLGRYGGPASNWQFNHEQKIRELEKELKDIKERNIPNKEEKKQIKNVQQNIKQLMEYFKINQKGFEETKNYGSNRKQKVLVKEINGIKVYNNIKYM